MTQEIEQQIIEISEKDDLVSKTFSRMIEIISNLIGQLAKEMNTENISDILIKKESIYIKGPGFTLGMPDKNINRKSIGFDACMRAITAHAPRYLPTMMRPTRIALTLKNGKRCRMQLSTEQHNICAAIRLFSSEIPTYKKLGFSDEHAKILNKIEKHRHGLVLISGATGNGKTTTMASILNSINQQYTQHIITLEDPIEYILESNKSIISQKEVGIDIPDFEIGLSEFALRENADIVTIGEARADKEFQQAMQASISGHLAMTTTHANGCINTIRRLFDKLDGHLRKESVNEMIAENLVAVISQILVRLNNGRTKLLYEIMYLGNEADPSAYSAILNGNYRELEAVLMRQSMPQLNEQVKTLLDKGAISIEEANRVSSKGKINRN